VSTLEKRTLVVLGVCLLHFAIFDRGMGGDGWASFATLESLRHDGDVWVENNLRGVRNGLVTVGEPGREHLVMQYPPGVLAFDLVPMVLGRSAVELGQALGLGPHQAVDVQPIGRAPPQLAASVAAIVLSRNLQVLLALAALAWAAVRTGTDRVRAPVVVGTVFLGGPLIFYGLVGMSHAPAFLLLSLLVLLMTWPWRGEGRIAFVAGLVLGFAILVRYGAVGVLPACLAYLALHRTRARDWLAFAAGVAACVAVLPFWWRFGSGSWSPPGYGGTWHFDVLAPIRILLSPHHGLFVFHPATLAAAVGLVLLAVKRPRWAIVLWTWFLGVAWLNGGWSEWANAGGWGQRFMIGALPVLTFGFAHLLSLSRRGWRTLAATTIVAGVAVGYLLFFGAVSGLAPAPVGLPWPQRPSDYAPMIRQLPGAREVGGGLCRASELIRLSGLCDR
jgi:hypothetical protein